MYVFSVVFFLDILVCLLIFKECAPNIQKGFETFASATRKHSILNVLSKVVAVSKGLLQTLHGT